MPVILVADDIAMRGLPQLIECKSAKSLPGFSFAHWEGWSQGTIEI